MFLTWLAAAQMTSKHVCNFHIRYMLLRRITQASDFQGPAPLDDKHTCEDTLHLLFGTVEEVEAVRGPAALALEQPLLVFYSMSPVTRPVWSPFSSQNETLSVDFFVRHSAASSDAAEYALRVQSLAPGGEFVEFQSLLPRGATVVACTEMTLSFQEPRAKVRQPFCSLQIFMFTAYLSHARQNDGERLQWQASARPRSARPVDEHSPCSDFFIGELDIRSFAIQFEHP